MKSWVRVSSILTTGISWRSWISLDRWSKSWRDRCSTYSRRLAGFFHFKNKNAQPVNTSLLCKWKYYCKVDLVFGFDPIRSICWQLLRNKITAEFTLLKNEVSHAMIFPLWSKWVFSGWKWDRWILHQCITVNKYLVIFITYVQVYQEHNIGTYLIALLIDKTF